MKPYVCLLCKAICKQSACQQEVDLHSLFKDGAHEYGHAAMTPEQARHLVERAMRIATVERAVTCLVIPQDVQELDAVPPPPHTHGTVRETGRGEAADRAGKE